jgi:hypothetical protein
VVAEIIITTMPPDWNVEEEMSADWPRCPNCGDYALDGQATCGRPWCDEVCRREQSERVTERIHVSGRRKPFWQRAECC